MGEKNAQKSVGAEQHSIPQNEIFHHIESKSSFYEILREI
jgi:hypothetical protein